MTAETPRGAYSGGLVNSQPTKRTLWSGCGAWASEGMRLFSAIRPFIDKHAMTPDGDRLHVLRFA